MRRRPRGHPPPAPPEASAQPRPPPPRRPSLGRRTPVGRPRRRAPARGWREGVVETDEQRRPPALLSRLGPAEVALGLGHAGGDGGRRPEHARQDQRHEVVRPPGRTGRSYRTWPRPGSGHPGSGPAAAAADRRDTGSAAPRSTQDSGSRTWTGFEARPGAERAIPGTGSGSHGPRAGFPAAPRGAHGRAAGSGASASPGNSASSRTLSPPRPPLATTAPRGPRSPGRPSAAATGGWHRPGLQRPPTPGRPRRAAHGPGRDGEAGGSGSICGRAESC
eukprot:scaffold11258_cov82-Isochrysis_galbana.AAC.3